MHLCILGYYRLADGYLAFGDTVRNTDELSFFPLMSYVHNKLMDQMDDIFTKFISSSLEGGHFYENMVLPKSTPDVIMLWIPPIDISDFLINLRKYFNGKIILHNWDPNYTEIDHPHWLSQKDLLLNIAKNVDFVLTVIPLEVEFYKRNDIKAYHCYSGFNEKY